MRQMSGDATAAFRAVMVCHYAERIDHKGEVTPAWEATAYYGPYATVGQAKARVTAVKREYAYVDTTWWRGKVTVTGHVECSLLAWEVVA